MPNSESAPLAKSERLALYADWAEEKAPRMGENEELYPADYVAFTWQRAFERGYINGLEDGVAKGSQKNQEEALQAFIRERHAIIKSKIGDAAALRDEISRTMLAMGYHPVKAYLRDEISGVFDLLFLVPEAEYLNPEFKRVYTVARTLKNSFCDSNFHLNVHFMALADKTDVNLLIADGYTLSHALNESGSSASRKAQ